MSKWEEALAALPEAGTVEEYEAWLHAGDSKFYDFFREYIIGIGHAEERDRIIHRLFAEEKHLRQVSESIEMDPYMSYEDSATFYYQAMFAKEFAEKLLREKIHGE